jgi:putative flippase GtrA
VLRLAVLRQLFRFGAVGASNTVLSFGAYAVALRLGVRYLPAGAGAFALGALNGFLLNRTWTFAHRGPARRAAWRYLTVQLIGLAATLALLRVGVRGIGLGRLEAQAAAAAPVTLLCFALSRSWVFGLAVVPPDACPTPEAPARRDRARRFGRRGELGGPLVLPAGDGGGPGSAGHG